MMEVSIDGYTLEQLENYKGISGRPDDFDDYWKRALGELDQVDPKVKLVPAQYESNIAECFDMSFTGIDGALLTAKYIRPKSTDKHPCVFCFHGYSAFSVDWSYYMPLVAEGMCVAALNCRGQGNDSEGIFRGKQWTMFGHVMRGIRSDNDDDLAFRSVFLDTVEIVRIVEKFDEVDSTRMGTYGTSQGGALSIVCSALHGGMNRTVTGLPFMSDFQHAVECREIYTCIEGVSYSEIKQYFYRYDPEHKTYKDVFRKLGYLDVINFAPMVKNEVLMALTFQDPICPPASHFAVYNNLAGPKQRKIYYDMGHEEGYGWKDAATQFLRGME